MRRGDPGCKSGTCNRNFYTIAGVSGYGSHTIFNQENKLKQFVRETVICCICDTAFEVNILSTQELEDLLCICPDCEDRGEGMVQGEALEEEGDDS